MLRRCILNIVILVLVAACSSQPSPNQGGGPRLLQDVTLAPTLPIPTRILSPTPEIEQSPRPTSEVSSPLNVVTVEADFVLVTPTLPPSKTPTNTPTITTTPTLSPTPSITVTATATIPVFPTSIINPVTAVVPNPQDVICDSVWFFIEPRPANCPVAAPTASQGVYQPFENGYMVWLGSQDAIYVFYNDITQPRWEVYRDEFEEGMPEDDPFFGDPPREGVWRPRRGFGMLWRNNDAVRDRIGWAIEEWEEPYSAQVQTAQDGTFFISEATGGVFGLLPGGRDWARYAGFDGF